MNSSNETNKIWKSISDFNNEQKSIKAKENEFMEGVTDEFDSSKLSGISRRKFLAVLSASAAFATTACSDYRDKGEIIPYNKRPEEVFPGIANNYASTCNGCSQSCGILIKTREGRPIKIDGNPDHPINQGKICAKGQASILHLYDPERLTDPKNGNQNTTWTEADNQIISILKDSVSNGKEIAVITGSITSPTTKKVLDDFAAKYPTTKIYSYQLVSDKNRKEAWRLSFGNDKYPTMKWDEAEIILALDSDFLGNEGTYVENMRLFTNKRESINKVDFNRLYVAEGRFSTTGMMSDYRLSISPNRQLEFVYSIINELSDANVISIDSNFKAKVSKYSIDNFGNKEKLHHLLKDLSLNKGKTIIYAGDTLPIDVHIAVNYLNEALGNSAMYNWNSIVNAQYNPATEAEINALINSMNSGKVGVLIHFDSNPAFTLPSEFEYKKASKNVGIVVSLTEAANESSELGKYTLPINHSLESWGDALARNNVYSTQQPVISPIFNTRQKEAILLTWIKGNSNSYNENIYHEYLRTNFIQTIYSQVKPLADEKTFWFSVLHDGVVELKETANSAKFNNNVVLNLPEAYSSKGIVLHLTEGFFVGDGKFANNGWLQETPHPVSKVTWDNYASLSPQTAKNLNVEMNDLVEISANNKKINIPVLVQPGVDHNTINVELGYGRRFVGDVGKDVGFDLIPFISKGINYIVEDVKVKKVAGTHKLISTQEHHSLDDKFIKDLHRIRKIIQEGTVAKYKKEPKFLHEEKEDLISITKEHEYTGNKWAMAIDLNKCTSCAACVTSCNVENNVPVVGKDQVEVGREMQWMRIDRYYSGTPDEPIASNQPMLCQHCDNAPCENVCPVNATNHSPDGLNQMVYNRCVGTRYCSNNCPYKVRRYNFYNFRDHFEDAYYENKLTAMGHNPEVTVRSRGVMEKCTFCIQRIMEARSNAIKEGKPLNGNDVKTACQQACPTNAIVFGDANDPTSEISKLRNHNLSYHVLEELNVKPNVTYIAKLRNTHSEDVI